MGALYETETFEVEVVWLAILSRRDFAQRLKDLWVGVDGRMRLLEPHPPLVAIPLSLGGIADNGKTGFHVVTW